MFILLWHITAPSALAQDLQSELPEESGPARVQPAPPPPQDKKAAPTREPEVEVPEVEPAHGAPGETPQGKHKGGPLGETPETMSKRLLNILTTEHGTNETAIVGRAQLAAEYRDRGDGFLQILETARVDVPLGARLLVRGDLPFVRQNPQGDFSSSITGLANASVRVGAQVWETPGLTLYTGSDVFFPTAQPGVKVVGAGKYTLGPGVAASLPVPELNSVVFPVLQHFVSVGGDPAMKDVSYSRLRVPLTTPWSRIWWTIIEPVLSVDWTQQAKTACTLELEAGRRLGDHYRVWVRPEVKLWGTNVPGAYDWSMQFGLRYMF